MPPTPGAPGATAPARPTRALRPVRPFPLLFAALVLALAAPHARAQSATGVPASFFAVSPVSPNNFPPLPMGTLGHPNFSWGTVEPAKDVFDFTAYDSYVNQARAAGLYDKPTNTVNMCITLGLTPRWALTDTTTCTRVNGRLCTAPPDSLRYWTSYVSALIHHFNGVTMPHVRYYELWNEADDVIWWTPSPPGSYTQLLAMAQPADSIVHLDPYSKLLTPSVTGQLGKMTTWMRGYLAAGGDKYADAGAFHGYLGASATVPYPMPEDSGGYGSIIQKVLGMRGVFDSSALKGKPMLQTEGSWGSFNVTDPDTQAAWLARYFLLQAGLRSTTNLQVADWFAWADSAFGWGDLETGAGTPNTAAIAYEQIFDWVVGATISEPCSLAANGTWTCTLTRPGGYLARAVWNSQGSASYTPGAGFDRYRTLAGGRVNISSGGSIQVGLKPKLVESGTRPAAVPADAPRAPRLAAFPSLTRGPTLLAFGAPLPAQGRITLRNVAGRVVRVLVAPAGSAGVTWDGRTWSGQPAASGVYFARLDGAGPGRDGRVVVLR